MPPLGRLNASDVLALSWETDEDGEPLSRSDIPSASKMLKCAYEMETYIANNKGYLVNYGERH